MLQDPLTLYKLIVLYMLDRVNFPLTKAQVCDFIQEKDYTNFFTLQQVIAELTDTQLITATTILNRTQLAITEEGRETLRFFGSRISAAIKEDVEAYLSEKELALRNEASVTANYYKSTSGEYEAHLMAKEKDVTMVEITLSVPNEDTAAAICNNWQKNNQDIYQYLVSKLF